MSDPAVNDASSPLTPLSLCGSPRVWQARHVRAALELRHPETDGEWVVLHEVLAIDTLAIRCWGGRVGHRRIAYEVKVSKADFRSELANPGKRERAYSITHEFYFAMPWPLAQEVKQEIPAGLGLLGCVYTHGQYIARLIRKARPLPPRPLTDAEVAAFVRHRAHPPALRHALLERSERNAEIKRLRNQLKGAAEAIADLAGDRLLPGAVLQPPWSKRGIVVLDGPVLRNGSVRVRCHDPYFGHESVEDVGLLLAAGYRIEPPNSSLGLNGTVTARATASEKVGEGQGEGAL